MREHDADGQRRGFEIRQHDLELLPFHLAMHMVGDEHAEPQPSDAGIDARRGLITGERTAYLDRERTAVFDELPCSTRHEARAAYAGQLRQFARVPGTARGPYKRGARDDDTPQCAHTYRNERGVAQMADAHGGVEALLHEIHHAI